MFCGEGVALLVVGWCILVWLCGNEFWCDIGFLGLLVRFRVGYDALLGSSWGLIFIVMWGTVWMFGVCI